MLSVNFRLRELLEINPATAVRIGFASLIALLDGVVEELLASRVETTHLRLSHHDRMLTSIQLILGVA